MKLLTGLLSGALAGLAVAGTPDAAEVYLLESHLPSSSNAAPRLPKEIARHILLQRVSHPTVTNITALSNMKLTTLDIKRQIRQRPRRHPSLYRSGDSDFIYK